MTKKLSIVFYCAIIAGPLVLSAAAEDREEVGLPNDLFVEPRTGLLEHRAGMVQLLGLDIP